MGKLISIAVMLSIAGVAKAEELPDLEAYMSGLERDVVSTGSIFTDNILTNFIPDGGSGIKSDFALDRDTLALTESCGRHSDRGECRFKIAAQFSIKDSEPHLLIYELAPAQE